MGCALRPALLSVVRIKMAKRFTRCELETEGAAEPEMHFTAGQAQGQAGSHIQHPRGHLRNVVGALWDK